MDLDLVGYLYGLLDGDEQARAEAALRTDPEVRARLERLRLNLTPLALVRDEEPPPAGLVDRTLALIAGRTGVVEPSRLHQPAGVVRPVHSSDAEPLFAPSRWRRVDAFVAASVLVLIGGLGLSGLGQLHRIHQRIVCQNNLREMDPILVRYGDDHRGRYPRVGERPPYNTGGAFVSILQDEGYLPPTGVKPCPSAVAVANGPASGPYAYPIGYRGPDGQLHGLQRFGGADEDLTPVLADRPIPVSHGGGQNVLFMGGNVRFATSPNVGFNGDHIFLNDVGLVAPGLHRFDSVLDARISQ
jgi:hypothetical protein